ncbi:hypothetical protein LV779_03085 [Streptomyces thinghirensis]|nr:hypothetical protein [Streptomyces thinghirensis]
MWGEWHRHALRELTTEQAAQILRDRAGLGAGTQEDAERLADRLGRMPLVLHQAGLYLARVRGIRSLARYFRSRHLQHVSGGPERAIRRAAGQPRRHRVRPA